MDNPTDTGALLPVTQDRNSPERKQARLLRRFEEIAEAAAAATPGGWHRTHGVIASIASHIHDDRKTVDIDRYVVATTDVARVNLMGHEPDIARESANARWITLTSPRNILSLIEAVREQLDSADLLNDANGHYSSVQLEEMARHRDGRGAGSVNEKAVMVCPQCDGEGGYPDGLDEAACHTDCTRCDGNGWIVDIAALAQPVEAGEDGTVE